MNRHHELTEADRAAWATARRRARRTILCAVLLAAVAAAWATLASGAV